MSRTGYTVISEGLFMGPLDISARTSIQTMTSPCIRLANCTFLLGLSVHISDPILYRLAFEAGQYAFDDSCGHSDDFQGSPLGPPQHSDSDIDADGEPDIGLEIVFEELSISSDSIAHNGGSIHRPPAAKRARTRSSRAKSKLVSPYKSTPTSSKLRKPTPVKRRLEQVAQPYSELPSYATTCMQCPICDFSGKRRADLERHYKCHFHLSDDDTKYVCSGVALDRAAEYGVTNLDHAEELHGETRVGRFCAMRFSRKDALLRHLRNPNLPCVCDILPAEDYIDVKPL